MSDGKVHSCRELWDQGVSGRTITRFEGRRYIHPLGRGRYLLDDAYVVVEEEHPRAYMLEEMAKACAIGGDYSAICLHSAAQWHDLSIDLSVPYVMVGVPWPRGRSKWEADLIQFVRWRSADPLEVGFEQVATYKGILYGSRIRSARWST
ncbi:hypothetical protein [Roseivivax sp. CAU 1761]